MTRRALVVEDDPDIVELVSHYLAKDGWEVEAVGAGRAAQERLSKAIERLVGCAIAGILNGQRAITGDTALRLGHFFSTRPEFWLNLQSLYDLRRAEGKVGKSLKTLRTLQHWKGRQRRQSAHAAARG